MNSKKITSNLLILSIIVSFLISLVIGCVKQEKVELIPKKTSLIVSIPDIMFKSPNEVSKILGEETSKYPIKEYNTEAVIGEGRTYYKSEKEVNSEYVVFNAEYSNDKLVYLWIELRKANITGTWQEALKRFGLTDVAPTTINFPKTTRRTFSGKPYKIVLTDDKENQIFYDLRIGTSLVRNQTNNGKN